MSEEEEEVQKLWGSEEEYYKEKEAFFKKHEGASAFRFDNETKAPVEAVYFFAPYTVFVDRRSLMEKLRQQDIEEAERRAG